MSEQVISQGPELVGGKVHWNLDRIPKLGYLDPALCLCWEGVS